MVATKMFSWHAIGASEIATIGDGYAQVMEGALVRIHEPHGHLMTERFLNLYYKGSCHHVLTGVHDQCVEQTLVHQRQARD